MVLSEYGDAGNNLRKAIVSLIKEICIEEIGDLSSSPLIVSRLVPLNKHPDLLPIGVADVLQQVMGKIVMSAFSEDVTTASSDA